MSKQYTTLILAALLHDIGKIGQRADTEKKLLSKETLNLADYLCPSDKGFHTHKHVLYTNEFCDLVKNTLPQTINQSELSNLASYHHKPSDDLQKIIMNADHLSSAMERGTPDEQATGKDFRKIPLMPVVNFVSVKPNGHSPEPYSYKINKYSSGSIFPVNPSELTDLSKDYITVWNRLLSDFKEIEIADEIKYINTVLSLLEKYLWSVPSATNVENPDISLFDHMKTTAAIAGCLHISENEERPFVLVAGDFGGIQKYVFNVKPGSGGLARALRGRSFEVSTLTDSVALAILDDLKLPLTQMIISAGGRFYLLLPNSDQAKESLKCHKTDLHNWILEEKNGELRFNLSWKEISKDNILNFPESLFEINHLLSVSSLKGFDPLQSNGKWNFEKWIAPGYSEKYEDICKSCYKKRIADGGELCADCTKDREIGREFVKASYQVIEFKGKLNYSTPFINYKLTDLLGEEDQAAAHIIDFRGASPDKYDKPYFTILKNNHVPQDSKGDVQTFEAIAAQCEGKPLLGYLKADIDNLGYIFSRGLMAENGNGKDKTSISRLTTLSRSLEYFFSGFIYDFLRDKYPYTYTVFSGGDDLLLIGPADNIIPLARDLQAEFARFTCHNESWGLSAGISLAKPRSPILHIQKEANRNLLTAKSGGKNRINVFSTTMSWKEYADSIEQGDKIVGWARDGILNSSKIYRFYGYAKDLKEFQETRNTSLLRVIPLMIYDLTRNWGNRTDQQRQAKAWAHVYANPDNKDIRLLSFICQYALMKLK